MASGRRSSSVLRRLGLAFEAVRLRFEPRHAAVNMVGEALATSAPVYMYEPSGGHPKVRRYLDGLIGRRLVRRWAGRVEDWRHDPVDATGEIASAIVRRYQAFRAR